MQVIVDGYAVNYVALGEEENPPVLFLHGWGSGSNAFRQLMETVSAAGFYAIALDYPEPREAWSVDNYVDIVRAFLVCVGVQPFAIVGHSFGGRIMLKEQFGAEKLIFIDSAGVKPKINPVRNVLAGAGKSVLPKRAREKLRDKFASEDYRDLPNDIMRTTFSNIVNEDLVECMAKITQPSLLIWGENDASTPLKDAEIFKANIRGAELEIIKDAGHYSFLDDFPAVNRLILEFLGR